MDLEQKAIARLKEASKMSLQYYSQPIIITTSGGKDSDVCLELAKRSGIEYEVQHSHTTADAPQTIYHVRNQFKELESQGIKCTINYPTYKGKRISMWRLIEHQKIPPTRLMRYCCDILKETAGKRRLITTGVRWSESYSRKNSRGTLEVLHRNKDKRIILNNDNDDKRLVLERCRVHAKIVCNPIVEWTDDNVWDYINSEKIQVNELYSCGFKRVGCIGCPMAGKKRWFDFEMFPTFKINYIKAFDRMLQNRLNIGQENGSWKTGQDVFDWWMQ